MVTRLGDIAYARSGDKGSGGNIGVIAHTPAGYEWLRENLTTDVAARFFRDIHPGEVKRYELPNLHAFNFLLPSALGGGGSISLRSDAQGKALGQIFLELQLEISPDQLAKCLPPECAP